jgi:Bacteriophage Lambda NinG protein
VCKRINDPEDKVCAFCQQPKPEGKKPSKIKKQKAYDEIYLWPVFSRYIRLRDTNADGVGKCFTCSLIRYWRDADCGHGAGRQHKGTKYNEINNHLQCKKCNGFESGMREAYKAEMDKRYGAGTWDLMQSASRNTTKLGKVECDIMIEFYLKEIEKLLLTKTPKVVADYRSLTEK